MPGTLFVVATPIGNLEDITLRALRILREVQVIAAEDTRRTAKLLRHYQISTPLLSVHAHNEYQRRNQIVERLLAGESVALVSDAGTPGISDPGAGVVKAAREAGVRVDPIPGPSAVTAALSASGLMTERFVFAGFPPVRSKDRKCWFAWVKDLSDLPVVAFEAPHRIERTLHELRVLFVKRPIIVVRELTKAFEEWTLDGTANQERGEFVIIIGQITENDADEDRSLVAAAPSISQISDAFGEITKSNYVGSRRDAVRAVADRFRLSTKTVYDALERAKN